MTLTVAFSFVSAFVFAGVLASAPAMDKPAYRNLKVLSNSLDEEQMERIMHSFNAELGVTCIYCHIIDKSSPPRADFASDEMPEKRIAREMLKMTLKLNRKYFDIKVDGRVATPVKIWCTTCHHGNEKPTPFKK